MKDEIGSPLSKISVYSPSSYLVKSKSIHWSARGLVLNRRYKTRALYRCQNFMLLILAFMASFCIIYHLTPIYGNGISGTMERQIGSQCEESEKSLYDDSTQSSGEQVNSTDTDSDTPIVPHFPRTRRRLPQCLIIGVRKGGTRALLEFLNLHPDVQKASDEIHFFDDNRKYRLGLTWYRRKMPYSFPQQVTIEKSPAYFITDQVPKRVYAMNSTIKLLLILRDPVTRLISDYAQLAENKAKKDRKMLSFEQLVLTSDGRINLNYKPVKTSIYAIFYARWAQIFPLEQMHVVDGDRLIFDPFHEIQKVEKFLGLEPRIKRNQFSFNATKGFYCIKLNSTGEKCLNESKGRPHPPVNKILMANLRRFYAPYNRQLYKMIGHDFRWPID